jgi:hypothetical protein
MATIRTGAVILLVAGLLAGCSVAPSPTPAPPSNGPSASPSAASGPTTAPARASPTTATTPSPSEAPAATPSPTVAAACGVQEDSGRLPSDRLVDVRISEDAGVDVVTFVFGDPSSPAPPQGSSTGAIRAVEPPFTASGSGAEVDVPGEHHVEVKFTAMTLYDEDGAPTYDGPTSFRESLPSLRAIAQYDAFEGHSGWIIGYDGPGCVTLSSGAGTVSVVIAHDPG